MTRKEKLCIISEFKMPSLANKERKLKTAREKYQIAKKE
jgi:hypothetical protein